MVGNAISQTGYSGYARRTDFNMSLCFRAHWHKYREIFECAGRVVHAKLCFFGRGLLSRLGR